MNITNAKYWKDPDSGQVTQIICTIDGLQAYVPTNSPNRYLTEINRQVSAGTLTVADAD